jgi:WD40 repeat protein
MQPLAVDAATGAPVPSWAWRYQLGDDGAVRVWRCGEGACVATLRGARGQGGAAPPPLWSLALSRDGDTLYAGADDGSIAVWQTRQRVAAGAMRGHTGSVRALVLSRDDATLYSAGEDRDIRGWAANTGQCVLQLRGHANNVTDVAWSPDDALLATASLDNYVFIWDATGVRVATLAGAPGAACGTLLCAKP